MQEVPHGERRGLIVRVRTMSKRRMHPSNRGSRFAPQLLKIVTSNPMQIMIRVPCLLRISVSMLTLNEVRESCNTTYHIVGT